MRQRGSLFWHCGIASALLCGTPLRSQPQSTATNPSLQNATLESPILTTAEQVHRLTREEAARGHRATIRGVITCSLPNSEAVVIQDSTRGIYVRQLGPELGPTPSVGELLELDGLTDPGEFAPIVRARRVTRLGKGELPQPIRPTWDQLINGSLDTQYVELEGIVTSVRADGVMLLTHGGKIEVLFQGTKTVNTKQYQDSLVRLRGCLFASWDARTHQVRIGEIRMFTPSVTIEEQAPQDVFAMSQKHAPELLLFDPQASALKRVKVCGQIVHLRGEDYFLMDGTDGLRFNPKEPTLFQIGDTVEVVGFPSLAGPSPVLRQAVARKIGSSPLPTAQRLDADKLFRAENDATRVQVQGVLLSLSADRQTLEIQTGLRRFLARLPDTTGSGVSGQLKRSINVPVGSQLELTGVYAGHGGNRTTEAETDSFELLLNAPTDVRLLAAPPFWTLQRLMILVGALVAVLAIALIWIRLLHHRVQSRTAQLQNEMRERELAEHQRALAQERARIARDLHDDLGSSLTEISMLATTGPGLNLPTQETSERLGMIAGKSLTMIHALDEIVWAVDPQRDTLASVARYLASYSEEYLAGLKVACRVQIPHVFPDHVISGEVRHELFLAVKEALNNAVRHGNASEIGFGVRLLENSLQLAIRDNGSGFSLPGNSNGDGLSNIRIRLQKLGGSCDITSSHGAGTTVSLQIPLQASNNGI